MAVIDLLTKCCEDTNHTTEAQCQHMVPLQKVVDIIRDPEGGALIRGAYSRFLTEVWLKTENPLNLTMDVSLFVAY